MFHYEKRGEKPLSKCEFILRLLKTFRLIGLFVGVSLLIGIVGYRYFEGMSWINSFLNACMILGGMGPVGGIDHAAGKIFAGIYAMYSGLAFLLMAGLLFAPIAHRILHRFHYDQDNKEDGQ